MFYEKNKVKCCSMPRMYAECQEFLYYNGVQWMKKNVIGNIIQENRSYLSWEEKYADEGSHSLGRSENIIL